LTSRLFNAPEFANYTDHLLDTQEVSAITDQDALSAAIQRVRVMGDARSQSMRLTFSPGSITVQARSDLAGEGVDELAADYDGPEFSFLLSATRMQETLEALKGDRIEIGFSIDPQICAHAQDHHKVLIRAPADAQFTSISMQPRA
jgi:DNA polymerase III sliding clamp (beta) subunit (PCNA family)